MEQAGLYLPQPSPDVPTCSSEASGKRQCDRKTQDSLSILLKNSIVSEGDLACTHSRSMIDR